MGPKGLGRLLVVPAVILGFGLAGGAVGIYYSVKAGDAKEEIERAQQLERQRRELLQALDEVEREIKEFRTKWDMDLWIPPFSDRLQAEIFTLGRLQEIFESSGAEEVKVQQTAPARLRTPQGRGRVPQRTGTQGVGKTPEEAAVYLMAEAKFRRWRDLLKVIRGIEEGPPLFILEDMECRKEGRSISVVMTVRFPLRREHEG